MEIIKPPFCGVRHHGGMNEIINMVKHDDIYNLFFLRVYKWNQMDPLGFIWFHLYALRKKKHKKAQKKKKKNIINFGIFWDFNP